jgi:hypothetical protein
MTVLTAAVIMMGVASSRSPSPLWGIIGPHAARKITRRIVKFVSFFISASYFRDFQTKQNVPLTFTPHAAVPNAKSII